MRMLKCTTMVIVVGGKALLLNYPTSTFSAVWGIKTILTGFSFYYYVSLFVSLIIGSSPLAKIFEMLSADVDIMVIKPVG